MKIITFEIDTLDSLTIQACAGVNLIYTNLFRYISVIKVKHITDITDTIALGRSCFVLVRLD